MKNKKLFFFVFLSTLMCIINIEAQQFQKLEQSYKSEMINEDEMMLNCLPYPPPIPSQIVFYLPCQQKVYRNPKVDK